jgi:eukaryotic-like serine/threonine-protein kinase
LTNLAMKPDRELEDAVFYAALNLSSPAQRKQFLDQACAGQDELRVQVEQLLAGEAEAEQLFAKGRAALNVTAELCEDITGQRVAASPPDSRRLSEEELGSRVGVYRLLQKIGEGGWGAVYLAEQEQPVRRTVALKIIKLGMDTRNVIARFEAERQALALMDHPNIARVFDAGATETGRPYFAMELVRGVKITDFCDEHHLDAQQRISLLIQVCHAIQHAHQKGIIHRDIKPSNVLVALHDGQPVPKVIDFGIAKAIEGRLTDLTLSTPFEQFIGTPAYMSPEQAERGGLDVDTRSDIYSLGVLLYELLTGKTPFDTRKLMKSGLDEVRWTLREKEPPRPSTMVTTLAGTELSALAKHRHVEPPRLISLLRGDLDWIIMKALEKDRQRRYETANGLAMDLQRHLDNEPVVARPPSRWYRLRKLVRRNKAVFAGGAAVAAALIVGLGTSTWMFIREREARQEQARLREEAERREKMTQAAMLVNQGRLAEADDLARRVSAAPLSLEAVSAFRSLGSWHALNGRWRQAAERFTTLLRVNPVVSWDSISGDFLSAGPVSIACGDLEGYERFRRGVIARVAGTADPVIAERTLKVSLLLPANPEVMESLSPLAAVAEDSLLTNRPNTDADVFLPAWRCISVALMEYRRGQFPQAADWCRRCLAYADRNPARTATAQVILAMACFRTHLVDDAHTLLAQSGQAIDAKFQQGLEMGSSPNGFWSDWLFARILLREARALIEEVPAANKDRRGQG